MLKDNFETAEYGFCDDVETHNPTLQDVFDAVTAHERLKPTRKRDLLSALRRFAKLTDRDLAECMLDMKQIREDFGEITTGPGKPSHKTLTNLRSDLLAAIDVSNVRKVLKTAQVPLLPAWNEYFSHIPDRGDRYAVSRFARYCSKLSITPDKVDDAVITVFAEQLLTSSGVRKPRQVHRRTAQAWNKVRACRPDTILYKSTLPEYRRKPTSVQPSDIASELANEIEAHLTWCAVAKPFDDNARVKALSTNTIILRRKQIFAALTALRDAQVEVCEISSLADLLMPEHVKSIIRQRYEATGRKPNAFNEGITRTLMAIAKEWVKPGNAQIDELKSIVARLPKLPSGMTEKNRKFLREVSDSAVKEALIQLPDKLLNPLAKKKVWTERDMVNAQIAIAIDLCLHTAVRMENLISLEFNTHLFLPSRNGDPGVLALKGEEVKNDMPMSFEIPPDTIARIRLYRRIVKQVTGYRGKVLFISKDRHRKHPSTLRSQITGRIAKHVGIKMTPHQFRHFSGLLMLNDDPGNFGNVGNFLGHKNNKTTRNFYTEIDTMQASLRQIELIDKLRKGDEEDRKS